MADTAPAPVKKAKVSKPKKPAAHPKYCDMVKAAIAALKKRGGSSRQKILKYILANYQVGEEKTINTHLKLALRSGVKSGLLMQSKRSGASGSFRLSDSAKKVPAEPKKPIVKKPADQKATKAKKPKSPAKKAAKKTTIKKPVAKKTTPKKATKSATKKPVKKNPKKAAKKPAKK